MYGHERLRLGSFSSFRICCIISGLWAKNDSWYQNTVSATVTWWYQFCINDTKLIPSSYRCWLGRLFRGGLPYIYGVSWRMKFIAVYPIMSGFNFCREVADIPRRFFKSLMAPFFHYFSDSYHSKSDNCHFSPEVRSLPYLHIDHTPKSRNDCI